MKDSLLRWGLLSTARINRALLGPLRSSRRNRLLAVASRDQDKAEQYARDHKIPRAYGSYKALLADPEVDVIYNPLPNHLHAEWTIQAVKAGKHVLCEKPLALSIQEVDAISSAAQKYDRVVAEAFMYRSHVQTFKVREIVQSGKLGRVRMVRGSFTFHLDNPGDYRLDPGMGGGSLWDVGCYPLSFTRAVLGVEPLEVFGYQVSGPTGIDETFAAQLKLPGEILAQLDCGFVTPYHVFMEVVGDEGTVVVPVPFNPGANGAIFLARKEKHERISIKGTAPYVSEVEDMADAILQRREPCVSLADSRANVAAIRALLESARTGRPVRLDYPSPSLDQAAPTSGAAR
jgi:predicted dehydrogenase